MMEHVHDSWWKGLTVLEGTSSPGSQKPQSARISSPGRCSAESKLKICKACWWGWCWALWAVSCVSHCEPARLGGEVKALRLFHQFFDDFQKIGLDFATLGGSSVAMFFTMFFDGLDSPWFSMTAAISGGPRVPAPRSLSVNHPATFFRALCLSLGWDSQEPKTTQTTKFLLGIWSLGKHQNWLFCRVYVMYVCMYKGGDCCGRLFLNYCCQVFN